MRIEEAEALTNGEVLARPHIAQLLVDKGYAFSIGDAFIKYLDRGARAYVSRERIEPEECIALIREAGGVAVLAHPAQCRLDDAGLEELVARLKRFGLWGIEAVYGANSPETTFRREQPGDDLPPPRARAALRPLRDGGQRLPRHRRPQRRHRHGGQRGLSAVGEARRKIIRRTKFIQSI